MQLDIQLGLINEQEEKPVTGKRNVIWGEDMKRSACDCLLPLKHVDKYVIADVQAAANVHMLDTCPWNMHYLGVLCLLMVDLRIDRWWMTSLTKILIGGFVFCVLCYVYLRQGGYVFTPVCLCVCLLAK